MVWKHEVSLEVLNAVSKNTLLEHLGIEFTAYGDDFIEARMPVDHRTVQPMGLLHGGASVALAESMGSAAGMLSIDNFQTHMPVGVEINANHLNSVTTGFVFARATPLKIGRRIQVWNIHIRDERDRPVCVSRLTIAIVERR